MRVFSMVFDFSAEGLFAGDLLDFGSKNVILTLGKRTANESRSNVGMPKK
jgi:hypothetical protein